MTDNSTSTGAIDPEIAAIAKVYETLSTLAPAAQKRVLDYVAQKLGLPVVSTRNSDSERSADDSSSSGSRRQEESETSIPAESDGISPVAQRWIKRSGISTADLSSIFSIGGEEIDLIAQKVPGDTKKERMRSVLLLKAMASYLATGAARTGHKEAKEACLHYDGWDSANFAANLKSFASEIGGSKESGYALNARGLSSATELIKGMTAATSAKRDG